MKKITLGKTDIQTIPCGFGALPVQRVSKADGVLLLQKAFEAGITFFDTARGYTDSEEKIGAALSEVRNSITIATKTHAKSPELFWQDLEESLRTLKTDYIDLYQFHNPGQCFKPGDGTGMYEAMLEAKGQGKVRWVGITSHQLNVAKEAAGSGLYDTIQYPFSYLASEEELSLVEQCREEGLGFVAMKALAGGLLTNAAAAYVYMQQYDHVLPIWGMQRMKELLEFIELNHNPPQMETDFLAVMERDREQLAGQFCRGCGYCMPCPMGIEINNAARMSLMLRRAPEAKQLSDGNQAMMKKIESCTQCGSCKSKCPYGLDTPQLLKRNLKDYQEVKETRK